MSDAEQLVEAVRRNDANTLRDLLSAHPKLLHGFVPRDFPHGQELWLPLHIAAAEGRDQMAAQLLTAGAQPDSRTRFESPFHGRATALHLAAAAGHVELVRRLIEHGATLEVRDAAERSPLALAVRGGHLEPARELLDAGAMRNPRDARGRTPLHEAIAAGLPADIAEALAVALLEAGADPNAACPPEPQAYTPLHRCVTVGPARLTIARRLLKAGADPDAPAPDEGPTPRELAETHLTTSEGANPFAELFRNRE